MNEMTYTEVEKYLKENDLYGEINQPINHTSLASLQNAVYDIQVTGDWKHDHGYLDYLMREKDYIRTREDVVHDEFDDGSDFYTAVHRYVYKPFYEMANGRMAE